MHHVPSPELRRLVDEPLAVPDRARRHLADCDRCQAESSQVAGDAALAARVLSAPAELSDIDLEWILLQDRLAAPGAAQRPAGRAPGRMPRRLTHISVGAGTAVVAGVLAVGAAAAAVLNTVYAPTRVAPVQVNAGDLRAIENVTGLGTGQLSASGSRQLTFGEVSWTTAGGPQQVSSIARASAITGLAFPTPGTLPGGVGAISQIMAQPQVTATIRFSQNAGPGVAGSTLEVTAGPAIAVQYGGATGGSNLPALAIVAARRPVASSTGATASQLETFLLSRPGLPAGLVQELRLLGKPGGVLPIPVPSGMWEQLQDVGGLPAVLITDPSAFASAVIWEGHDGVVHAVGGLLDKVDALNVARQVG
jgi:hypothetical protein